MKHILEFARFSDMVITKDEEIIKHINKKFVNDTRLVFHIDIKSCNKILILKWHDTDEHSMIKKIEERTHFKSISEFNDFIKKTFNDLFDNHFKEITEQDNIYGLYFLERQFSLIVDFSNEKNPIGYDNIFNNKLPLVHVTTLTLSTPDDCKIITINDENF
jgi:hypothetical protein